MLSWRVRPLSIESSLELSNTEDGTSIVAPQVNGKPSCANDWLLQTVARDQWEFDGYITRFGYTHLASLCTPHSRALSLPRPVSGSLWAWHII